MNPPFWRDKRVFMTGHTGFKGSWLALLLHALGARVVGYSLPAPTCPSLFEAAGVARRLDHHEGDVRDAEQLADHLRAARPEIVVHMAAQSLVRRSYRQPVETFDINVMGTVHLLDAVRRAPSARVVLIVTSDKCYANPEGLNHGFRESDPMGGSDPYSGSKGCAELVTQAFRHAFFSAAPGGVAVASVRAGNVIGGGDWAEDRLIPDIYRAFSQGRRVMLRHPDAIRPWQHVLEPLSGYLRLAEKLWEDPVAHIGGWNFGPAVEDALTVREVVEQFAAIWGESVGWESQPGEHPHEAQTLRLDCAKASQLLNWHPRWKVAQGLRATATWYRAFSDGADPSELTLGQIEAFLRGSIPAETGPA